MKKTDYIGAEAILTVTHDDGRDYHPDFFAVDYGLGFVAKERNANLYPSELINLSYG